MIDGTTATATDTSGASGAASAQSRYDEQYDTFLQLLTTQLQNQLPTSDTSTTQLRNSVRHARHGERRELDGGKRGRAGPNKTPFVVAVETTEPRRAEAAPHGAADRNA